LRDCIYDPDIAVFNSIDDAKRMIPQNIGFSEFALMAQEDQYDVNKLEKCDGSIPCIRVSFHSYDYKEGLEFCRKVIDKGYQCYINPINILGYTDEQLLAIIRDVNRINPYALTIVDTFGSMVKNDLLRIYQLLEHNLKSSINIGIHLHENLSLSYSLAQQFTEIKSPSRHISIDGSLYGMGRIPGNLCIELMMDYMNRNFGSNYITEEAFDVIDDYIVPIKKKNPWGYSVTYALSAKYGLHRTYAEFLMGKERLPTKSIQRILSQIDPIKGAIFDKEYIQGLYIDFINNVIDDKNDMEKLNTEIAVYNTFLVICPGSSLKLYEEEIKNFIEEKKPCIFMVNCNHESIKANYQFYTSTKRYDKEKEYIEVKKIITSNVLREKIEELFIVNFHDLAFFNDNFSDNSTLMVINLLKKLGIYEIYLAGFDGFKKGNNFYDDTFEKAYNYEYEEENNHVKKIITHYFNDMKLIFLTPSLYQDI
jgi:4-hydroxy 2-oxovalerate aldolase